MMDIPCFIINLEQDIKKQEQMKKVCRKNDFKPIFIKAIYGKALRTDYLNTVVNQNMAKEYFGRELSPGEIGVALSQLSIYERMIKDNIEIALILEDDVDFNFSPSYLSGLVYNLPQDWECIMLGHHTKRSRTIDTLASIWKQKKLSSKNTLVRFAENPVGAYGYIINLSGARKMLNEYKTIYKPIDKWSDKILNIYGVIPSLIAVDEIFISDSLLLQERSSITQYRTPFQSFKDKVQLTLKKMKLLEIYFKIKSFFIQFKKLSNYKEIIK